MTQLSDESMIQITYTSKGKEKVRESGGWERKVRAEEKETLKK